MRVEKQKNIIPVFIVVLVVAFFRVALFIISYVSIYYYNQTAVTKIPTSNIISFTGIAPPIILFVEAFIYYFSRRRLFLKKYVQLHLWTTIFSSFLLPLLSIILIAIILPSYWSGKELSNIVIQTEFFLTYGLWGLFGFARLFFIITIVKSVTSPKEPEIEDESTGFLNEFTH